MITKNYYDRPKKASAVAMGISMLIIIILLLLMPKNACGQKNSFALLYMPQDNGLGIRGDSRLFRDDQGLYASLSYGNYYLNTGAHILNHVKMAWGYTKYFRDWGRPGNILTPFSVGINIHSFGEYVHKTIPIPKKAFFPISIEFGVGAKINKFACGMVCDPIRWEAGVYAGFYFND